MPATLEDQLGLLHTELKSYIDKSTEETKSFGTVLETTKNAVEALQKQADAIDQKIAEKHAAGEGDTKSLEVQLQENDNVQRIMRDRSGRATFTIDGKTVQRILERKTTITSTTVGWQTTGVLPIERIPGLVEEARRPLTIRDLLPSRATSYQVIDFVKVTTPMAIASPVAEGAVKPEAALGFTAYSERVKTLAVWIPATRQILDDFTELSGYLQTALPYSVNLAEDLQLLSGDGTGENLHGILPQATAFSTSLLTAAAGWQRIDVIGRAIEQISVANEVDPTFVAMHPHDWWSLRLTKDSFGRYMLGDPQMIGAPNIFGLSVVGTSSMTQGTFLVGNGNPAAIEIRDRMSMQVEISTEHSDFFTRNLVAVRAEKRLALVVKRPASFVTGTLNSSPVT